MTLIRTTGLDLRMGEKPICSGLDFELAAGQFWALLGGNGVGKTTLLHALAGLRPAHAGSIMIEGTALGAWRRKDLARRLGVLFQDSQDTFPASVVEIALSGRHPHLPPWAMESRDDLVRALDALALVELDGMAQRQVDTLSGGERRRLAIAVLLVQNPRAWLLDEPSNHLDLRHQMGLLDLIRERVTAANGGAVMALHDVNLALRFCTHAVLMIDHDRILCGPVAEVINPENLEQLYRYPVRCVQDPGGDRIYLPGPGG